MSGRAEAQTAPTSCPEGVRPHLAEALERGGVLVLVLDEERVIRWANRAFCDCLSLDHSPAGTPLAELLEEEHGRLLRQLNLAAVAEQGPLDLVHAAPAGGRTIQYHFFPCGEGLVGALGRDRTSEVELIEQMAVLIEDLHREVNKRAELSRELERLAVTDFLTGLHNRRHFDRILADEWGRRKRYGSRFALILLDLDHFKKVNDRFGHQAGDEVLRRVAAMLRQEVRAEDVVARFGGEEFAVIALGASSENGRDLAERLLRRVAEAEPRQGLPPMTLTAGVAGTDDMPPLTHLEDLIAGADQALYLGKQSGRNRVEVHVFPA